MEHHVIGDAEAATQGRVAGAENPAQKTILKLRAIGESDARAPVVCIALSRSGNHGVEHFGQRCPEIAQRDGGRFIAHAQVQGKVTRHLDVVLKEISLPQLREAVAG